MSDKEYDSSFITETLPAFISEAAEHIQMLEQLLLQLEASPADRDLLDALFRSAHTIKGSAGIFGVEPVVAFTHHVETLLEQMRAGRRALTPELSTLLLQCNDQIRSLLGAAAKQLDESPEAAVIREELVRRLRVAYGDDAHANRTACERSEKSPEGSGPASEDAQLWRISVGFGGDTFRNGMDPLAILNYLRVIGRILNLSCDLSAVPDLESIDPEICHLGFSFELETTQPRAKIESAFSFVIDDCILEITASGIEGPVAATPAAAPAAAERPKPPNPTPKPGTADDSRFIRVEADRLDHVINLLGELVIASAGASLLARQTRQGTLIEANQQITSLVE